MNYEKKSSFNISKEDERKIAAYTEKVKYADLVEDIKFRENAPVKRMRYNQSAMTIAHSPKNKYFDYEKIPSIISIMFCEFDIFGLNNPIYEIKRHVNDTDIVSENGIRELYVNLTAEVKDNKLKALFDILKELNYINNQIFPNLSKTKEKFNNMMEGDNQMSGLTREIYIDGYETGEKKGIEQGKLSVLVNLVKDKLLSVAEAAKQLGVSENEFIELAKA